MEATVPGRNGGRLLPGGKPGHKTTGAGGRKPDKLRELFAKGTVLSMQTLIERMEKDPDSMTPADYARIAGLGGQYVVGTKIQFEQSLAEHFTELASLTAEFIPEEKYDEWLQAALSILTTSSDVQESTQDSDTSDSETP